MRTELAGEIDRVRDEVADAVSATLLSHHPDRAEPDVDGAAAPGVQGVRRHLDFLRAAVELDDPATFRDYALWCRDLLDARGLDGALLTESLGDLGDELSGRLSPRAAETVDLALRAAADALAGAHPSPRPLGDRLSSACRLYLAATLAGRRENALAVVREAVDGGASPLDVYTDIFQNALYEVGRRWQTAGLTVAEEHMATATTQFILSVLQEESPRAPGRRGTAVVTGVVNERHLVGASIVANVLEAEGWDVRFLGTDLPHDAIISTIEQRRAGLVAISVTMSECVAGAGALIAGIRRRCTPPPRILVGGGAFLADPELWQALGADQFAPDARRVAELARA